MIIAPDKEVPWSSIIYSLADLIEKYSTEHQSEYFLGLKYEACTLLMQDSWIAADRFSKNMGVVGSKDKCFFFYFQILCFNIFFGKNLCLKIVFLDACLYWGGSPVTNDFMWAKLSVRFLKRTV
jgi:hypothetical protein